MNVAYPVLDPRAPDAARSAVCVGVCALAMMIKAPRPGASKTRLSPPLTPEECSALSGCFLRDTTASIAAACADAAAGPAPAGGVAAYTPVGMERAFNGLLPEGFVLVAQRDTGFGDRLFHMIEDLLALGYGSACLINSDSPTVPARAFTAAAAALARPGDRIVLGPSEDGGYYLIGLKRAHRELFERIDWSTERVAAQTLERAAALGLEVETLPTWYDVDDAPTLRALCRELFAGETRGQEPGYAAPWTRGFLARLLTQEGRARVWPPEPGETFVRIAP